MAEEVQIAGTSEVAKIRNPLAPALLPFVTFGIYTLVWYYKINKEMAEMGKARNTEELGTSPDTSLMAVCSAGSSSSRRSCPSTTRGSARSRPRD